MGLWQSFKILLACIFTDLIQKVFEWFFGPRPPRLNCWLWAHPRIADSIKWQFKFESSAYDVPESAKKPWRNWTRSKRRDLRMAFREAWFWHNSQADPFQNLQEDLQYPPINLHENISNDNSMPWVAVAEAYAWQLYIRWVALNLLTELENHFSWSVLDYGRKKLQILFDSTAIMSRRSDGTYSVCSGYPGHVNYVKRKDNLGGSLIAPPRYTYAFLVRNNLVGDTRYQTIARLLQWVSDNLTHFVGGSNYSNMEDHWQYRGIPPITRIIEGTTASSTGEFRHWTAGCHGTSGFLRNVLRAANIPAQLVRICGHSVVCFITEGLYLDHADNPYNSTFKATGLPASDLLIDEATFHAWFGTNPDNHEDNCSYIGHQVEVLAGQ